MYEGIDVMYLENRNYDALGYWVVLTKFGLFIYAGNSKPARFQYFFRIESVYLQ